MSHANAENPENCQMIQAQIAPTDQEAKKETLEAFIASFIANIPFGEKRTVDELVKRAQASPVDVCKIVFELSKKGNIKFDEQVGKWSDLGPSTQFEPTL